MVKITTLFIVAATVMSQVTIYCVQGMCNGNLNLGVLKLLVGETTLVLIR